MPFRFRLRESSAPRHADSRAQQRDLVALLLDDGRNVDVLRVRDPRARRIKLSVSERGVRLTLPERASLVAGDRFLAEHRDWLGAQLDRLVETEVAPIVRGESDRLPLRGRMLPLRWEPGRFTAVQLDGDGDDACAVFQATSRAGDAALHRALRDFYEAQARADIGRWMPRYLPELPRAPRRVQLKIMSSQWGSLAPDGTMALDLSLVLAPPDAFRIRAGARAVPPHPPRSLARLLARSGAPLPALARPARLVPRTRPPAQGADGRAGALRRTARQL